VLNCAITFFLLAVIAGVLGFGVVAGLAAMIAKGLFVLFVLLFVAALLGRRRV
jgi:uncharacterized membrane protein YtjA (UPF0391 family)